MKWSGVSLRKENRRQGEDFSASEHNLMHQELTTIPSRQLGRAGLDRLPAASSFTANNPQQKQPRRLRPGRAAVLRLAQLPRIHDLDQIRPVVIANYIEVQA